MHPSTVRFGCAHRQVYELQEQGFIIRLIWKCGAMGQRRA
jgi:hypothetical protein